MFISNKKFKLINNEGLEKYFDISNRDIPPKVVGYGRIPMMNIRLLNRSSSKAHFYKEYVSDEEFMDI